MSTGSVSPSAFNWRQWKPWERALAIVGALGVFFTIGFGIFQLKTANDLQRAALDSHLGEVMMDLDRHFVAYPQVRRYFYAHKTHQPPLPRSGPLRAQVFSTAELVVDFADDVAAYVRARKMLAEDADHWSGIVGAYYDESRATRKIWHDFYTAYSPETACILDVASEEQLEREYEQRHGAPPDHWLGGCDHPRRRSAPATTAIQAAKP